MTLQSNDTIAPSSTGAPVFSVLHTVPAKRSSTLTPAPNLRDNASCEAPSVFTHSTPFSINALCADDCWLTQTSSVGGESVTLQTAEAAIPAFPPTPSLVTTCTAAPNLDI